VLIDDSYNASPASFHAAIDVLAQQTGRKILIVGDMGELGELGPQAHAEVGTYAKQSGIDLLWATGPQAVLSANAFGTSGQHFAKQVDLIAAAQRELSKGDIALVKGSRSAAMERVVTKIKIGASLECWYGSRVI
jgi:UDP-N-acetylmuramoyl-tripeptide--D-alanyl-D-alanine ligase